MFVNGTTIKKMKNEYFMLDIDAPAPHGSYDLSTYFDMFFFYLSLILIVPILLTRNPSVINSLSAENCIKIRT